MLASLGGQPGVDGQRPGTRGIGQLVDDIGGIHRKVSTVEVEIRASERFGYHVGG